MQTAPTDINMPRPWHPWLFAVYPGLHLYAVNLREALFLDAAILMAGSLAFASILALLTRALPVSTHVRALFATGGLIAFYGYGPVIYVRGQIATTTWSVGAARLEALALIVGGAAAIMLYRLLRTSRSHVPWTRFLNAFSAVVLLIAVGNIAIGFATGDRGAESVSFSPPSDATTSNPDIVVLVLDGYGGSDVLKEFYDFDNAPFLSELRERGFQVIDPAHSNYPFTEISLASLTNMQYILHPGGEPSAQTTDAERPAVMASRRLRNSALVEILKARGYEHVAFETGFSSAEIPNADRYLQADGTISDLHAAFIENTLLTPLLRAIGRDFYQYVMMRDRRARFRFTLDTLRSIESSDGAPQFVWAHLVFPHRPFVFDADGNEIETPKSLAEERQHYHRLYRGQIAYVNKEVLKTLDALTVNLTDPLILILGDHGPRFWEAREEFATQDVQRDWMSTMIAVRTPSSGATNPLYPGVTHVNVFRLLLNDLFGFDFERLPDQSFVPKEPNTHDFEVVTWNGPDPQPYEAGATL